MHPRYIVIIGNIGVGKTTTGMSLAKKLKGQFIEADKFYAINPFFQDAVTDRKRWSLTSDLWFLQQRIVMTRKVLGRKRKRLLVVDSGILMSYVYASSRMIEGYLDKNEWKFYKQLYTRLTDNLPTPDLIIALEAPLPTIKERITKRGREFEIANYTNKYLLGIQKSLERAIKVFQKQAIPILRIDAQNPVEDSLEKIHQKLTT